MTESTANREALSTALHFLFNSRGKLDSEPIINWTKWLEADIQALNDVLLEYTILTGISTPEAIIDNIMETEYPNKYFTACNILARSIIDTFGPEDLESLIPASSKTPEIRTALRQANCPYLARGCFPAAKPPEQSP